MKRVLFALIAMLVPFSAFAEEKEKADPMKQAVAEMIQGVTKGAGEAKEFLMAQLPDVLQQLLMWKMAESILYTVVSAIGLFFGYRYAKRIVMDEDFWDRINEFPAQAIISVGITLVPCGLLIYNLCNPVWLQILVAPKVYLIEYAHGLLK